jgi:hypothetical protein
MILLIKFISLQLEIGFLFREYKDTANLSIENEHYIISFKEIFKKKFTTTIKVLALFVKMILKYWKLRSSQKSGCYKQF